ncbi:pyridoxine/pyridoxamine 5'-phosphate oxidase [Halopseudomonas salegens]|uniref:Pyridoxamine 5'-phosphate oxidase n=1 Tax=Halopseudomonas salegens TaxID=1434072 RepID=A0A1H2HLD7_9GAMM|nr:pyridoxal 5'-phosphate synthase [Halopseudomonas salegens]SDU32644.1 Pyridoxamine 5'-phosphate oxidase [Halopseudomonas salegens]
MDNPIAKFEQCWQAALADSPLQQKSAICVSTIDAQGFPAGRFVDLKAVTNDGFIFCTNLDSVKARHLQHNAKIALTAWWDHAGYQIRVVGLAQAITAAEADRFWHARNREAQLASSAFNQSEPLSRETELTTRFNQTADAHAGQPVPRPDNWGGFCVQPVSIEFLTFQNDRLHLREYFARSGDGWIKQLLQP